ncbi:hypothetical protein SynSYN20_00233 [Synechococcus sp. SYN20]|nr:hypothetical protein SynSYN20_00233 [Synechococcus sp. SYN20]
MDQAHTGEKIVLAKVGQPMSASEFPGSRLRRSASQAV